MHSATRRPVTAIAAVTTAGALALSPIVVTPPELPTPGIAAARISSQAIQLTDAWSELASDTVSSVVELGKLVIGTDTTFPLPSPSFPLAPVATQLVLNQLIYVAQLFTGDGGNIPLEIGTHLNELGKVAAQVVQALPQVIPQQLYTPILAAQEAIKFVLGSANPVAALFQAPAVFLDIALNSDAGLLGIYGPIGLPVVIRNLITKAIYTPAPTIVLPFKKAAGATLKPKATTTTASPKASGVAGSARAGSKNAPSAASSSAKNAGAAKSGNSKPGQGHRGRG